MNQPLAKRDVSTQQAPITEQGMGQSQWYQLSLSDKQAKFLAITDAALTLTNRGFAYGDGFFTTMRVSAGRIGWQAQHLARIHNHAQALSLAIDADTLTQLESQLSQQAQTLNDGILKVIITRSAQSIRGYGFTDSPVGRAYECRLQAIPTISTVASETSTTLALPNGTEVALHSPIKAVCLQAQIACLPPSLAGLKTLNRLDSVLASAELQRIKSAALINPPIEGLVKDMGGDWVEGTMSNVFYRLKDSQHPHKGHWYTPPLTRSGVKGVMRSVIIDGFADYEKPVIERYLMDKDLPHITQMFFCNAVRGVMPVAQLALDAQIELGLLPIDSASLNSVIT
jgi:4-amino-4-deoxychorismate lyase